MVTPVKRGGLFAPILAVLLGCCLLANGVRAWAQTGANLIDGFVFNDASGDDLFGPGDFTLTGVMLTLRDSNGAVIATAQTDPSGEFQFRNVPTGTYTVNEADPPGFGSVDAEPGTRGANVDLNTVRIEMEPGLSTYAGTVFLDRQMAAQPAGPNLIRGAVFNDADGNGNLDVGEQPVPGVMVTLQTEAGSPIASRQTSRFGEFAFSGLASGVYLLVESDPQGATSVGALAGTGGQIVNPNTIRVTTTGGAIRYANHAFLDRIADVPIPTPVPTPTPTPTPTPGTGLSLILSVDQLRAAPGDILTYTFAVSGIGAAAAERAAVYIPLPAGAEFLDAANGGALAGDTLAWSFAALATNTGGIGSFRVRVAANALPGSLIRSQGYLVVPAQQTGVSSTPVATVVATPGASLTLAMTADRSTVRPGDVVTYTLTYANISGGAVADVVLVDPLPVGLVFLEADANVLIDIGSRSLRFNRGSLAAGAVGVVSIRARVDAGVPNGTLISNGAQLLAAGLSQPIASNAVAVSVRTTSLAGTYSLILNAPQPTSLTVDDAGRLTVITFPGSGQPPVLVTQGSLKADGSFDLVPAIGSAQLTGRVDAGSRTAVLTVQRPNVPSYTVTLPRAADFASLPPAITGTFQGSAIGPTGDWLRVRLSVDPGGNATFQADLIQFAAQQSRSRSGSYLVTPDGHLVLGGQLNDQIQAAGGSLMLTYTFVGEDGYRATFQVPLVRV